MSETENNKRALRRELRAQRASLDARARERASAEIARRVYELAEWRDANAVFAYLSVRDEVDTSALVERAWREGKLVAAPRVVGPRWLEWHWICEGDDLETSGFGIPEPLGEGATLVGPGDLGAAGAIALVPGLAFDKHGYRIGYGGGYYDAFLGAFQGFAVGLCYEGLLQEDFASAGCLEAHDVAVDVVVTA